MKDYTQLPEVEITWIDQGNFAAFTQYIPVQLAELAQVGGGLGIIDETDTACGALVFDVEDACCRILSLCIAPESRRSHMATTLLATLVEGMEISPEWGVQNIQVAFSTTEENGLVPFFQSLGFQVEQEDEETYLFTVGDLIDSNFSVTKGASVPLGMEVVPMGNLKPVQIKDINQIIEQREILYLEEGISLETVDGELSYAVYGQGELKACCCLSPIEGGFYISQVYVEPDKKLPLVLVLEYTAQALMKMPRETVVAIPLVSEQAARLAEYVVKRIAFKKEPTYTAILML